MVCINMVINRAPTGVVGTFRYKFRNDPMQQISTDPEDSYSPTGKPPVGEMVESIVGCKWSLHVLAQLRRGVNRPGELARTKTGLTTKVLNERLAKMVRFGIVVKQIYPESPPRVEYHFTDFGHKFLGVLDAIDQLQDEMDNR